MPAFVHGAANLGTRMHLPSPKPCPALFRIAGDGSSAPGPCGLASVPRRSPVGCRSGFAPRGELLGGQARPVGSHSCLPGRRPSIWAREPLQQPAVRLCKRLYTPGSFGIGWVPSGNEGKAPSELDKSRSGAGSNRHLASLNFQCSSFQRHMLCLNLLQTSSLAYHRACTRAMKFC